MGRTWSPGRPPHLQPRWAALPLVLASLALVPPAAGGDSIPLPRPTAASIVGLAFDSTAAAPLAGARITLIARDGVRVEDETTTDAQGRFRFDGVADGERRLLLTHPRLDELALTPILRTVNVTPDAETSVVLGIPSLASLWPLYCPDAPPPAPTAGVLSGRVLDSVTEVPQPAVDVTARWVGADGRTARTRSRTDRSGAFTLCGVPTDGPLTLTATFLDDLMVEEEVRLGGRQVAARDLTLPVGRPGTIRGTLTDADTGEPIAAAVVTLAGTDRRAVTGRDGEFRFADLDQGEYLLQMEHLAYGTQSRELALGNRILQVDARFSREAIELEGITVSVLQPVLEEEGFYQRERRHSATSVTHLTGEELMARDSTSLPWALQNIWDTEVRMTGENGAELQHRSRGRTCTLPIFVDGMLLRGVFNLGSLKPDEIEGIEIYPPQMAGLNILPERFRLYPGYPGCGGVLIWTK